MKILFLGVVYQLVLGALFAEVNQVALRIQAKLYPRIFMMELRHEEKMHENSFVLGIASCTAGKKQAEAFTEELESQYRGTIQSHPLIASFLVKNPETLQGISAIYFGCGCSEKSYTEIIALAKEAEIVTFACDLAHLDSGILVGIDIGRQVRPVINTTTLKQGKFEFPASFFNVTKNRP